MISLSKINGTAVRLKVLWLFLFFFTSLIVSGQSLTEPSDSISVSLEEIEIISNYGEKAKGGNLRLKTDDLLTSVRSMGEADAINYFKFLSGIRSGGDYGSGLIIDGFQPSQSLFSINSVPLFFPYRFGGIFSTFNSPHFNSITFERALHNASMPSRLGAKVDFKTSRRINEKVSGVANIGILASSVSIFIPVKNKLMISFSGRISYVDVLLRQLLKNSYDLSYNFYDLNLNLLWDINDDNSLSLDAFSNSDRLKYKDGDYAMQDKINWSNDLIALSWHHQGATEMTQRIFYSGFRNKLSIDMPQFLLDSPSAMDLLGIAGDFLNRTGDASFTVNYGYELNAYREKSQSVSILGLEDRPSSPSKISHPFETRIYADTRFNLGKYLKLDAGLSLSLFRNPPSYTTFNPDPRITLSYPIGPGNLSLHLGRYSQYLHQVGFSQIGLASDFWVAATKEIPAQNSYNIELDYTGAINSFSFSATAYWRRMLHQPDFFGQILDLLDVSYNPADNIRVYNGFNCGINFSGGFDYKSLTARVGAGYGIARRRDPEYEGYIRGNTEPGFTCNIDANYQLSSHWQFGARFRYATGRPYTPIRAMYIVAGNLIKEYAPPNSALFPATHQLDLSASWSTRTNFKSSSLRHIVNLSLINAYGHKNVEIMTYTFDMETGKVYLRKVYSLYRFLPSLSYTLEF